MVRDGWVMVIPLAALAAGSLAIGYLAPGAVWYVLASVFAGLALFIGFFFRDPAREVPPGEGLVISGGDGKVVTVEEIESDEFIGGPARQISVFPVHRERARQPDTDHRRGKRYAGGSKGSSNSPSGTRPRATTPRWSWASKGTKAAS